jgi:serine phosphatase RsbU (regulator of sigma subunit)
MPYLRLTAADGTQERIALRAEGLTVGRSRDCDLILPDVLLSRRHAEVRPQGKAWVVRDLGSMNGTRLNGVRLQGAQRLRDGDVIALADWRLVFLAEAEEGADVVGDTGFSARLVDIADLGTRSDVRPGDLARQSRLLGVLTRAAEALVSSLSVEALLAALLDHLLDALPAQRGVVAFLREGGGVDLRAARARTGPRPDQVAEVLLHRMAGERTALLLPRLEEGDAVRTVLAAPLWFAAPAEAPDRVIGIVAVDAPAAPEVFTNEDLGLLTAVTNLAASRLESVRLRQETLEKKRLEDDVRGAARIQSSLLPEEAPQLAGYDIAAASRLCRAVGADYYDFAADDLGLRLALGDVAGKGLAAALLMAALRGSVRALWQEPDPLPRTLARINESLCESMPENRYATLVLARLDPATGALSWVNAGHAAPRIVRASGRVESLEQGGTVLGVFPRPCWEEGKTRLEPGDVLVAFSDGVVEAGHAAARPAGPEAMAAIVDRERDRDAAGIIDALQKASDEALGEARSLDDRTFLVLKRLPTG